jgi:hypothetical protein
MGAHGSAGERMGAQGSSWERMGAHGSAWERMGAHGSAWERMGAHGCRNGEDLLAHARALTSSFQFWGAFSKSSDRNRSYSLSSLMRFLSP